ncbi:hypothetical protein ASPBRDRAFT_137396, partial [Aspergillus brasiliensis CBS 101740]
QTPNLQYDYSHRPGPVPIHSRPRKGPGAYQTCADLVSLEKQLSTSYHSAVIHRGIQKQESKIHLGVKM